MKQKVLRKKTLSCMAVTLMAGISSMASRFANTLLCMLFVAMASRAAATMYAENFASDTDSDSGATGTNGVIGTDANSNNNTNEDYHIQMPKNIPA